MLNVGALHGGTRSNIIPDSAEVLTDDTAHLSDSSRAMMLDGIERLVAAEAAAAGSPEQSLVEIAMGYPVVHTALPFRCAPGRPEGSGCAGGAGMAFMHAALDGSGGSAPCPAPLFRPLIRHCGPSLCRALPAERGRTARPPKRVRVTWQFVVGIDVAKEFHWVAIVVAETGKVVVSQRVDNDPDSIED
ncbi:hypothetical protein ACIHDR_38530 [Nocardia sp. NPDC052278]|uniref:hypothetical protein n=1 Tax=unclassified Nocardia TaxID=2637762 RepID=UPI0036812905